MHLIDSHRCSITLRKTRTVFTLTEPWRRYRRCTECWSREDYYLSLPHTHPNAGLVVRPFTRGYSMSLLEAFYVCVTATRYAGHPGIRSPDYYWHIWSRTVCFLHWLGMAAQTIVSSRRVIFLASYTRGTKRDDCVYGADAQRWRASAILWGPRQKHEIGQFILCVARRI